jgi:predicted flavoprotein YhiN
LNLPTKIISGGQCGADRAGLDAALTLGIPISGYVTKGRRAEDGKVPDIYPLIELPTADYPTRTEKNVVESDATLLFTVCGLNGGSLLTKNLASKHNKPCLRVNLDLVGDHVAAQKVKDWLMDHQISVLNIAGSRESKDPGVVWARTKRILELALGPT